MRRKINVAQFISSIQDGGAETLVKDYVLMLDKSKFRPIVIVLWRYSGEANEKILTENNTRIISIYKSTFFPIKVIQRLNQWWYIPYRLKSICQQENIDVMHIHLSLLRFVDKIKHKIKNTKLLYTCHNELKVHLSDKMKKEGIAAKRLIINNNLQMIALHDDMRKEINDMFEIDNTIVIRNGIDFKRFQNIAESQAEIRETFKIPQNAFVLGHIGRFFEQKNHDFLIDIFKEVYKKNSNAFLLMIGVGKLMDTVKAKIDRLNLTDRVMILSHRSDIPQLLKAMDVFVFPSLYEGLGIVLIEAQISGLKCIVSDAVPKEAFQTELAIPISLNESPSKWCDIILDDSIKGISHGNIEDYDMNKEIKRLEKLYLGELND